LVLNFPQFALPSMVLVSGGLCRSQFQPHVCGMRLPVLGVHFLKLLHVLPSLSDHLYRAGLE